MTGCLYPQGSYRCPLPLVPDLISLFCCFISITNVCGQLWCDGMYLFSDAVLVCTCMHAVLDRGLWRISAQETRGPCGPLMGMELTIEDCCRAHRASAFLLDAPHATHTHTHTHEKLETFTTLSKKKKAQTEHGHRRFGVHAFYTKLACIEGMQIQRQHLC